MTARLESSKPRTKPDHVLFQFPFAQPSFPFCSRIRGSEARERDDQETPKLLLKLMVEVGPRRASLALGLLIAVTTARAATFYCDPIKGSPEGDGTSARPWRTIHEVIKNVFVNARDGDDNHDDGIQLGQKKNQATGNTVRNNFAHSFDFKADASVQAESNQEVTEAVFNQRLAELARDIADFDEFGHPFRKYSDSHPRYSDRCRSVATLCSDS